MPKILITTYTKCTVLQTRFKPTLINFNLCPKKQKITSKKTSTSSIIYFASYASLSSTNFSHHVFLIFLFSAALEEEQRNNANSNGTEKSELSTKQKHQMKHRELFLSRQVETLPATHIRGKCSVTLLNEEESLLSYLNKDVSVQYCLSFHSWLLPRIAQFSSRSLGAYLSGYILLLSRLRPNTKDSLSRQRRNTRR